MARKTDSIVAEIRERRRAHAESFDYDLKRIARDFQRQEQKTTRRIVTRPARAPGTSQKASAPS